MYIFGDEYFLSVTRLCHSSCCYFLPVCTSKNLVTIDQDKLLQHLARKFLACFAVVRVSTQTSYAHVLKPRKAQLARGDVRNETEVFPRASLTGLPQAGALLPEVECREAPRKSWLLHTKYFVCFYKIKIPAKINKLHLGTNASLQKIWRNLCSYRSFLT